MQQIHPKQNPKSMSRQIAQRDRGGKRGADGEHDAERLDQVTNAACERCREQSHGRACAKHESKLLGRQPPRAEKGR
jgi:hypothetical protein